MEIILCVSMCLMGTRINSSTAKYGHPQVTPIEALRGKGWVEKTLAAVFGMWRNRKNVDPVAWQQAIRSEWDENSKRRISVRQSKKHSPQ